MGEDITPQPDKTEAPTTGPSSVSIFDVIKLRNWDTVRAFLYVLVPVALTASQVTHLDLWIPLALAVLAPLISSANAVDVFRAWFYRVLAAGQTVLLGLDLFTSYQVSVWVSVISAIVGGSVASSNIKASPTGPLQAI